MSEDVLLTDEQLNAALQDLDGWELREGWLRRKYTTPGWSHKLMLANAIAYCADAAWHHPDLELGYAQVIVKLQTHRVRGITAGDVELAKRIQEIALWKPDRNSTLPGFPKNWVK